MIWKEWYTPQTASRKARNIAAFTSRTSHALGDPCVFM